MLLAFSQSLIDAGVCSSKRRPAIVGLQRASWTGWARLYLRTRQVLSLIGTNEIRRGTPAPGTIPRYSRSELT